MRLKEMMVTDLQTVTPQDSAVFANELMWRRRIHHLLVMEGDTLVGVLSDTDLGGPQAQEIPDNLKVADVMTREVRTAEPDMTVTEAIKLMKGRGIHCLPVVQGDRVLGMVTSTDLMTLSQRGRAQAPFEGVDALPPSRQGGIHSNL